MLNDIGSGAIYPEHLQNSLARANTQIGQIMWPDFSQLDKDTTVWIFSTLERTMDNLNARREVKVHDWTISASNDENYKESA